MVKGLIFWFFCAGLLIAGGESVPQTFDQGDYRVDLKPNPDNVGPFVTFAGRSIMFAYRTDGYLRDGDRRLDFHSFPTNATAVRVRSEKDVRVDYVQTLYVGAETNRVVVGHCSNEVVFAEGRVGVRATLYPAQPGRYRFAHATKASQVVVFPNFAKDWVGATLEGVVRDDVHVLNELMPHAAFDPKAWGMGVNEAGYLRQAIFAKVPDVITIAAGKDAGISINRYRGGFEVGAAFMNDEMHRPAWDGPISYSYSFKLEK